MRVVYGGAGIVIGLAKDDKEIIMEKGELEARMENRKDYPMFYLHIIDEVEKKDMLTDEGYHIESTPPITSDVSREQYEKYDFYLSKENFMKMINEANTSNDRTGHIGTRSMHDRIEFVYWDI